MYSPMVAVAGGAEKWVWSLQKYLPASREGSESAGSSEDPRGILGSTAGAGRALRAAGPGRGVPTGRGELMLVKASRPQVWVSIRTRLVLCPWLRESGGSLGSMRQQMLPEASFGL